MKTFGLKEKDWEIVVKQLINPLKAHGAQVWVFGSRARGNHHPFSDLDVLYDLNGQRLPLSQVAGMQQSLEDSSLPIKVDFVNVADLAESYRDSVFRDRTAV